MKCFCEVWLYLIILFQSGVLPSNSGSTTTTANKLTGNQLTLIGREGGHRNILLYLKPSCPNPHFVMKLRHDEIIGNLSFVVSLLRSIDLARKFRWRPKNKNKQSLPHSGSISVRNFRFLVAKWVYLSKKWRARHTLPPLVSDSRERPLQNWCLCSSIIINLRIPSMAWDQQEVNHVWMLSLHNWSPKTKKIKYFIILAVLCWSM